MTRAGGERGQARAADDAVSGAAPAGAARGSAWIIPAEAVTDWIDRAAPGEELIYAAGPMLIQCETARMVRALYLASLVTMYQRRSPVGFEYCVRKLQAPAREPQGQRIADDDPALDVILRALRRAANFGRRAPSNAELARLAGLETAAQAAWRVRKLVLAGRIRVQMTETGPHANWRTVTIVSSGRSTLPPPHVRAARRDLARERTDG